MFGIILWSEAFFFFFFFICLPCNSTLNGGCELFIVEESKGFFFRFRFFLLKLKGGPFTLITNPVLRMCVLSFSVTC